MSIILDGTTGVTTPNGTVSNNLTLSNSTVNGVAYLNASKVLTTGSALTFDGSKFGVGGNPASTGLDTGVTQAFIVAPNSNTGAAATFIADSVGRGVLVADQAKTTIASIAVGSSVVGIGSNSNTPVAFSVNASEQMRLTSTGLGIGTSSPATKLDVQISGGRFQVYPAVTATGVRLLSVNTGNSTAVPMEISGTDIRFTNSSNSLVGIFDSSGNLGVDLTPANGYGKLQARASSTALPTGDSNVPAGYAYAQFSGNSGAVSDWLLLRGPYNTAGHKTGILLQDTFYDNNAYGGRYIQAAGGALTFGQMINGTIYSSNGTLTEHARIDTSGNLLVGRTSASPSAGYGGGSGCNVVSTGQQIGIGCDGAKDAIYIQKNSTSGVYLAFYYGTLSSTPTLVGSVSTNGSTTTYSTSSDYRLKENIQPMTGALSRVAALKPCTYTWKADGSAGEGFIAHELQEVCPDAVAGEKDAVNEDGSIKPQGIDTSFLVATLTAAIQEQQTIIESLTARIAALEGK